jgi:hypothetical protein
VHKTGCHGQQGPVTLGTRRKQLHILARQSLRCRSVRIGLSKPLVQLPGLFKGAVEHALPGKPFIWLPFAGGISAFAVILPKPMGTGHGVGGGYPDASHVNGCYAETLDRKTGSNFGSL